MLLYQSFPEAIFGAWACMRRWRCCEHMVADDVKNFKVRDPRVRSPILLNQGLFAPEQLNLNLLEKVKFLQGLSCVEVGVCKVMKKISIDFQLDFCNGVWAGRAHWGHWRKHDGRERFHFCRSGATELPDCRPIHLDGYCIPSCEAHRLQITACDMCMSHSPGSM